jgi:hypothetical protein
LARRASRNFGPAQAAIAKPRRAAYISALKKVGHAAAPRIPFCMIRIVLQWAGWFALAGAFAALSIDVSRSFSAGRLVVTQLGETATALAPARMALLRTALDPDAHPLVAHLVPAIERLPIAVAFAALGALALWLGRKPRPKIGYSSR